MITRKCLEVISDVKCLDRLWNEMREQQKSIGIIMIMIIVLTSSRIKINEPVEK